MKSLYSVFDPIPYIDIVLFANLLLLFLGWYLLADTLFPTCERIRSLVFAGCGTVGSVLLASNIFEVWFWGAGTMIYGIAISLAVVSSALTLRLIRQTGTPKSALIPAAVCCFLACGGSELGAASLAAFLCFMLIWLRVVRKKWDGRLIFLFLEVCLTCTAILLLSGTTGLAGEHAHVDDGASLLKSVIERLPAILEWVRIALWGYTFIRWQYWTVYLSVFFLLGIGSGFGAKERKEFLIAAALLVLTAHAVLFINGVLDYMPPRVVTVGICWLLGAGALLALALGSLLPKPASRSLWTIAALLVCLSAARFYQHEIDGVRAVRSGWERRDAELLPLKGSGENVTTCSLPSPGSSGMDIGEDPENEYNQSAALYYGFERIAAPEKCVDKWYREENGE